MDPILHLDLLFRTSGRDGLSAMVGSFSVVSGILTAIFAAQRGRSAIGWFLIGAFLPWIGLALVFLVPPRGSTARARGPGYAGPPPPSMGGMPFGDSRGPWPATASAPMAPGPFPMAPQPAAGPVAPPPPMPIPMPPPAPRSCMPAPARGTVDPAGAAAALPTDGWFYATRAAPMGPVPLDFVRTSVRTGALNTSVMVWCPAFREWVPLNRVPGLLV